VTSWGVIRNTGSRKSWEGARTFQWVEQAGKGGKRKTGRLTLATPSAPPLIHT